MNYTAKFPPKYEAVWDVWGEKKAVRKINTFATYEKRLEGCAG